MHTITEENWEGKKEDVLMSLNDLADDGDWESILNEYIYPSMIEFGKQCAEKAFNETLFECNAWNENLDPSDLLKQIKNGISKRP